MDGAQDLPRGWPKLARTAVVQLAAIAHVALTRTRGWCADSRLARRRLVVSFVDDRRHLPVVSFQRAA